MAVLDVKNLSVRIGEKDLVSDVSFSVTPGEVLSVIGPNGAGKTTLLRAITGDAPSTGELRLNDRPLSDWSPKERALSLAVLTQSNPLAFAFTVEEVVSLGRGPHSTGTVIDREVCQEAMAALDVSHLANRLYPSLSGGEKQRTQLARVMAQIWRPDGNADRLLLLDEPVTSLDLGHQRQLMQAVRRFADSGVAVLMVVHDISLAAAYSDEVLALNDGRLVALGSPESVVTESLIGDLFGTEVRVIAHPVSGKPVVLAG
ncbi:heme ABC transporter ATP-binding protein [Marinimicrobium sp. ABcell2]|uniref:heme ABC transporter ATP-binding protein n=1 Tax=Marinimicrobium sp. ABcell2 TaxID=3069751 RepID=UPI0027B53110|nr:heme ABC transporter ATP-binding protein [Marinimicrobium sp. ABcell2]MDQ2076732.1 heme ABC transporter ATP-binding protein [Marinimicrobium sp. ABcell2]